MPITTDRIARDDRQLREISQLLIFVTENSANLINQPLRLGLLWEGFREEKLVRLSWMQFSGLDLGQKMANCVDIYLHRKWTGWVSFALTNRGHI